MGSTHSEVRNSPRIERSRRADDNRGQKRARAKLEYDAFLANCPNRQLLDRISDKWVALILAALGGDGPRPGAATQANRAPCRYSSSPGASPGSARRCSPRRCAPSNVTGCSPGQ